MYQFNLNYIWSNWVGPTQLQFIQWIIFLSVGYWSLSSRNDPIFFCSLHWRNLSLYNKITTTHFKQIRFWWKNVIKFRGKVYSNFFKFVQQLFFFECKAKNFKRFLFWLELTAHESQKSVSQNIIIKNIRFPKINKKKGFAKQKSSSSLKCIHLSTQYLVGAPLAQTPASETCGVEAIGLWHCLQLVWIVGMTVYHLSLDNTP